MASKENQFIIPGSQNFHHSTPIQLRFNDIDTMGHVNNAIYQDYFDFGKVAYFNHVLGSDVNWNLTGLVLAKITIEYLLPIEINEEIELRTKIIRLGNKSFDMYQEVIGKNTSEVKATGLSVMIGFSKTENSTIVISDTWRQKILGFEKISKPLK